MSTPDTRRATGQQRAGLEQLRHGLLALHKTLLDVERLRYERQHGRIPDGYPLLDKVMNDPAFAWLRELSALIVTIDENLENEELTLTAARMLNDHARKLVTPREHGGDFQQRFYQAMQESPAAVMAHRAVSPLLGESGPVT
jgi:hypothetical protein